MTQRRRHREHPWASSRPQGVPQRMLRWHYRSRHESLIAVSNRQFYENGSSSSPAPTSARPGWACTSIRSRTASSTRERHATNPVEARVVAEAVIEHAQTSIPKQSLGVAAFSVASAGRILDELERPAAPTRDGGVLPDASTGAVLRQEPGKHPGRRARRHLHIGRLRHGHDGYMAMHFGPLSSEGGERRLNVLISRGQAALRGLRLDDGRGHRSRARPAARVSPR